ncbi:MAG: MBOAT family protein [Cyclobacteriaceae bacterium]|nr:MBOAT family protein [Cyclobacteriaceae bacterium]
MWQPDIHKLLDQFAYHRQEPLIFNSGFFLLLFTAFMVVYTRIAHTHRAKLTFVTLFSLYFYYKSSGIYFLILVGSTLVDYTLANLIYRSKTHTRKLYLLVFSLVVNLGMLGYFKYTNFLHEIFSNLAGIAYQPLDIFLPVGVSFFTFQSLSYTIDIYRGTLKPVDNIFDYAFFVSFFPQLVAGPIVRASDFLPQINQPTVVTREMFGKGVFLIVTGLFKKAIISNYISLNFVDRIFDAPSLYTGLENLFGVYGYALQIYCDFSGYSDMAIGIALLLGFRFCLNFDSPYQSSSITEFWRRWHMSLSTWLRDYLYISLGGNRHGKLRTYFNQFITMVLGGLWHGASFRFILWGALHGLALALHKVFLEFRWFNPDQFRPAFKRVWHVGSVLLTFHFVCFCWIFFRAADMDTAWSVITQITTHFNAQILPDFAAGYKTVLLLMLLGYTLHYLPHALETRVAQLVTDSHLAWKMALVSAMIVLVIQTKSAGIQPFIYFQF